MHIYIINLKEKRHKKNRNSPKLPCADYVKVVLFKINIPF